MQKHTAYIEELCSQLTTQLAILVKDDVQNPLLQCNPWQ